MKVTIIIEDENGKVDILNKTEELIKTTKIETESVSQYARFFDESCTGWDKDSEISLFFLKHQQMYANSLLVSRGYLFLNDVYDMLGIPRSTEGQVVGWVYDKDNPVGDNYVDFGIYNEYNKDFVNGHKRSILLDFNVDGCIIDKIK